MTLKVLKLKMPPIRDVQIFRLSLKVFLRYLLVQLTVDISGKCLCYSVLLLSHSMHSPHK